MKALILNNKVVGIEEKEFEVHKDQFFMDAPEGCMVGWELKDGVLVPFELPTLSYQERRSLEYPLLVDQLDMQYHDAVNGTTTWKDAIAKVKSDIPKE